MSHVFQEGSHYKGLGPIATGSLSLSLRAPLERLNESINLESTWEIDVPNDNSCLFWAVTLAYLLPVLEEEAIFQVRFKRAFGEEETDKFDAIRLLLKSYNPFGDTGIFKNFELNRLIREQFRRRTVEYVADHAENFRNFWDSGNNRLETTFEDYLSRMQDANSWGGELEINAMSLLLNCGIKVFSGNNKSHYSVNSSTQVELIHVNADQGASSGNNHYRFRIDKTLGDNYQKKSVEDMQSTSLRQGVAPLLSLLQEAITEKNEKLEASYFLKKYQCNALEEALYKATSVQDIQDVQNLLILGAQPNAHPAGQERTALHQVVLNKDEKIAVLLLLYGAKSNIPDIEQVTADTYADRARFSLQALRKKALNEAVLRKDYPKQCSLLRELAQKALQDQDYADAAMLFMGSLAIVQNHAAAFKGPQLIEESILTNAKEVEASLIKQVVKSGIYRPDFPEAYGINPQHLEFLTKIRSEVSEKSKLFEGLGSLPDRKTIAEIEATFLFVSDKICQFLKNLFEDSIRLLQENPPCGYAVIGTGSLARGEMTLYSDIEYFVLIEEDTPKNRQYFHHLSQIFQIKMIMLGETDLNKGHNLLPTIMQNPTRKGLSLDVHKNPAQTKISLIGTPTQMAKYQHPDHYVQESNNHFSGAFINLIFITGSHEGLLSDLKEEIQKIYQAFGKNDQEPTLRTKRSLLMLSEDIDHFKPKTGLASEGQLFDAKFDFYRLPQTIIDSLALYKNLKSVSTWERIRELLTLGFFSETGAIRLLQLLSFSAWLRLRTYNHYGSQQESLDVFFMLRREEGLTTELHYRLSESDLFILTEMYKILMPLHQSAKAFHQANASTEKSFLVEFYDDSSLMLAKIASRLCQYKTALDIYTKVLREAKETEDIQAEIKAYNRLADIATKLGLNEEANDYLKSSLALYFIHEKGASFNTAKVLIALANVGSIKEGVEYLKKALTILDRVSNLEDTEMATARQNVGTAFFRLGKIKEAIGCFIQAKDMEIRLKGPDSPGLICMYSGLGAVYQDQSQDLMALASYKEALRIVRKTYGLKHPLAAMLFLNLGTLFQQRARYQEALEYYQLALEINIILLGITHPDVIKIYNNLGVLWMEQKKNEYAKACFEEAIRLHSMSQDQDEVSLACDQNNIGSLHHATGEYEKADQAWRRALAILKSANITDHYKYATALNNLAMAMHSMGKAEEAEKHLNEALKIVESKFGRRTPESVTILYNQGLVFISLEKYQDALNHFGAALQSLVSVYGHGHPKEIPILRSSAKLAHFMGGFMVEVEAREERPSAVQLYHKLLDLMADAYGEDSPLFIKELLTFDQMTILHTYVRTAQTYLDLGNSEKAKHFLELAMDLSLSLHGQCHPDTALVLFETGIYYRCIQQPEKADKYFKILFHMVKDNFGIDHPITFYIFGRLKVDIREDKFYFHLKEMPMQQANPENQVRLMEELKGLVKKLKMIARDHSLLSELDTERLCLEQALSYAREAYGEKSMVSVDIYLSLGRCWHALQDFEKAQEYFNLSLELAASLLGEDDPKLSVIIREIERVACKTVAPTQETPIQPNLEPKPLIFSQPTSVSASVARSEPPVLRLATSLENFKF